MAKLKRNRSGLTLVELILSIAIMGIIAITFMPLFVISSKTVNKSETTLDSTYLGKNAMELVYDLSRNFPYEKLEEELIKNGYEKDVSNDIFCYKYNDKKYLDMRFTEKGNLIKVVVKVYKDETKDQLEVQYESLYPWFGRGILSEK